MDLKKMTKEQLIAYINSQDELIQPLCSSRLPKTDKSVALSALFEVPSPVSGIVPIGLAITEPDGTIISFNKAIQDLLGISIDEFKDKNICELYADPDDRRRLMDLLARSNMVRNFEVALKEKSGTLRTVLANIDRIEWNGRYVLLTSIYDVSQSKQIYNKSDKYYHTLFSNVPVGITVTDFQGNLIISNNAVNELLDYTEKELKEINAADFYLIKSDRQKLIEMTKNLGNVRDFETMFKHKDGHAVSVLINTDIIEFNHQQGILLTSIRDISNLKRIEDELIKERDFSNIILNIAATLIVVLDSEGKITRFNRACEQLTGYFFNEVNGTYLWDHNFFDPVITQETIDLLLNGSYTNAYETVLLSKDGLKHIISWTFAAMLSQEKQVEYVIATGIDITKRKSVEESLQKANMELASWVSELRERTEELNQLNEMGEQLQSCQTVEEACAISVQYVRRICPFSQGALYLIGESKDYAEAVEMWGDPILTKKVFSPTNCWSIRRGRKHLVDSEHPGLLCGHVTGPKSGQYLCIPLLINGGAIGILHLSHIDEAERDTEESTSLSYTDHKVQIVTTIAEHIALALSNLKLKETFRQQSIRDSLTGLFNRRYMEETLERELTRARREDKSLGVIMFDIDHFKDFNDLNGHDGGDALLRELGRFLNTNIRKGDVVCRYGGEEFLVVLPGISRENARLRAEALRKGVKELSIYHLGQLLPTCTISLGVAVFPENGLTSETLLKSADTALYYAKNEGRDRVVLA